MKNTRSQSFGLWSSPIEAKHLTTATVDLKQNFTDPKTASTYRIEQRPSEAGRQTIINTANAFDLTPSHNVYSIVHEYGGAAACALGGNVVFVSKNILFQIFDDGEIVQLVDEDLLCFYGNLEVHPGLACVVCIQEQHFEGGAISDIKNSLVSIKLAKKNEPFDKQKNIPQVVISGNDFYTSPTFNLDGSRIAYLSWDHPEMPWTAAKLSIAKWDAKNASLVDDSVSFLVDGGVSGAAGQSNSIACSQPKWGKSEEDKNLIYYMCDRTGFFNIYCAEVVEVDGLLKVQKTRNLLPVDFVMASLDWNFGRSDYEVLSDGRILLSYTTKGLTNFILFDPKTQSKTILSTKYIQISEIHSSKASTGEEEEIIFSAGTASEFFATYTFKIPQQGLVDVNKIEFKVIKKSSEFQIDKEYISSSETMEFVASGDGEKFCGTFYNPKNPNFVAPEGEKPPLIVWAHGGPTSTNNVFLRLDIQYWTTRGFAMLLVEYGGSSGFGRKYRNRLQGAWGVVDMNDCCDSVSQLGSRIDQTKTAITGQSSGGYTVLCSLAFRPEVFSCGVSKYGVCDLISLSKLTHKFESRYLDGLLGGSAEDCKDLYVERSPLYKAGQIKAPVLVLQGDLDMVVPKEQSDRIVEAVRGSGNGDCEYVVFEGEKHGFKKAENIIAAIETQLSFFKRVWNLNQIIK